MKDRNVWGINQNPWGLPEKKEKPKSSYFSALDEYAKAEEEKRKARRRKSARFINLS